MEERQPWEQQEGEPNRWYQRFNAYRLMGPGRSIEAVWAEAEAGRSKAKRPSSRWYEITQEWQWKSRANAYDQHLTNLAEQRIEAEWRDRIMGPSEVLGRLSEMARVNPSEFTHIENKGRAIRLNETALQERGHLIKSISTSSGKTNSVRIDAYDAQSALRAMGEHLRLFDKPEDNHRSDTARMVTIPADLIAPPFLAPLRDIRDQRHTEYVLYGGRGSTKSSFISLAIIWQLINNPSMHALAVRQVGETLRDSVFAQLTWAISELDHFYPGLEADFKRTTSPLEMTYLPTGQKIYFRGADDPGKIKSIKPPFGHIGLAWFEELDQFHGEEAIRKIEQSAIRGGEIAFIFKSFNPPITATNWANKYIRIPKASQYQHKSSYLEVPPEWLGKTFLDEAEHLKTVNPNAYNHEYLGEVTGTGGMVFENVQIRKITDEEIAQFDRVLHGLDWGFYPDPAAYVRCHYDAARLTLYIYSEYRANKLGNRALFDALVKRGLTPQDLLIADSAEPKSIADFRDYGSSCRGAEKGPDSVAYSMKWLQSLAAIVIDNERCPETAQEFLDYEFERNKDGEIISAYPDQNNHHIDATRYATNLIWKRRGQ